MDDRGNTIAGWVLFGGIAALGLSIVTGEYFHDERPEKMGYVVEGVEAEAGEGAAAADKPIEFYLASASVEKGAEVFKKCAACHVVAKGGANGVGPNLYGTVGAAHGHVAGFPYSDALKGKPGNWDWANLNAWLTSPKAYAPGTKMTFAGLGKPEDRANVIAYLNSTSDSPLPLPAAPAEAAAAPAAPAEGASGQPSTPEGGTSTVQTEAQAAKSPKGNIAGEAAPATSGTSTQEK